MAKTIDLNGRPEYPATLADLDVRLDEKNAALAAKIETMQKQEAEQLAAFVQSTTKPKATTAK
jgi:hypothetical protein